jgi:hypothetical protein
MKNIEPTRTKKSLNLPKPVAAYFMADKVTATPSHSVSLRMPW